MKKVVLFAFCVAFEHATFALHNSDKISGWTSRWSWDGGHSSRHGKLSDEDLVEMLYSRRGRSQADHPTLEQRLEYRRTYEVTEEPEGDSSWTANEEIYGSSLDSPQDLPLPDNAISPDTQQQPSSSSSFMSSSNGDSLYTAYSHKIIHNKK